MQDLVNGDAVRVQKRGRKDRLLLRRVTSADLPSRSSIVSTSFSSAGLELPGTPYQTFFDERSLEPGDSSSDAWQ